MTRFILTLVLVSFLVRTSVNAQSTLEVVKTDSIDSEKSHKDVLDSNEYQNNSEKLNSIVSNTERTSRNTEPSGLNRVDWDEYLNIGLALIAAVGTFLTFYQILITNKQQSINKKFQKEILSDLLRHLYRNKVCVCALYQKLKDFGFETHYPSEEHILKLKVLPEDLHFERFNNSPDHYDSLHELELKFRNFNIEVDVALEHFKSRALNKNIKLRDFDTLEFKSQYLTDQTMKLSNNLGFKWTDEWLKKEIQKISVRYKNDLKTNNEEVEEEDVVMSMNPREDKRKNYYDNLGVGDELDADIRSEYEKISVIAFPS